MYIDLGPDAVIKTDSIIGIFDLDTSTVSKRTRSFLSKAEKDGNAKTVSFDLPKSFILCSDKEDEQKIYISQLSVSTVVKRSKSACNL